MTNPKTIAFACYELTANFQLPLFRAIKTAAINHNLNLIVFEGRSVGSKFYSDADHNCVYQLIHPDQYDALVLSGGSLFTFVSRDEATTWASSFYQKPLVSLNFKLPNATSILVNSQKGMHEAISFLNEKLNLTQIAFVTGPAGNAEAEDRYRAYLNTMADCGLSTDNYVFRGDFTPSSGVIALQEILDSGLPIEAILFANDDMAIATIDYLNQSNPEKLNEISLIGFDNSIPSKTLTPKLASIAQPFTEMATKIINHVLTDDYPHTVESLDCKFIPRESCGSKNPVEHELFSKKYFSLAFKIQENIHAVDEETLSEQLANALPHFGIKNCYICLYVGGLIDLTEADAPEYSRVLFAYENNRLVEQNYQPVFKTKELLPTEDKINLPKQCVVKSMFFQKVHSGYIIIDINQGLEEDYANITSFLSIHIYSMIQMRNLEVANQGKEKANNDLQILNTKLRLANERLRLQSTTDELTGLLNRRGFFERIKAFAISGRANQTFMAFYADVDNLKKVNDSFGHKHGDEVIKSCAHILKKTFRTEDFIGRVGGDEFLICARNCNPVNISNMLQRLRDKVKRFNLANPSIPDIDISMGHAYFNGSTEEDIIQVFEKADEMLYKTKQSKKKSMLTK